MAEITFKSGLKDELAAFLNYKRNLGSPYRSGAYYLADFDRFCVESFPDSDQLSKHICMSWAVKRPKENASGLMSRVESRQYANSGNILTGLVVKHL